MSGSTWDVLGGASSAGARQRQRRRNWSAKPAGTPAPRASVVAVAITPPPVSGKRALAGPALAILAVLAVHVGAIAVWQKTPVAAPPQALKQQVVELVRPTPPEKVEPPKPLPQTLTPPPRLAARPVARPAPSPTPAPAPRPIEPVAANTPTPAVTVAAPPPVPPPVAEAVPEQVSAPIGYAGYLHNPAPVYPANAQRMGLQGKVILRVRVLASGKAASVEIQASSGRKMLDEAAVSAVHGWLFSPSRRGQTAIDGWATVPIEFKLERS